MSRKKVCTCGKVIADTVTCSCRISADKKRYKEKNEKGGELHKLLKSARWKRFRQMILDRDAAHCLRCLHKYNIISTTNLEIHHIKPRSKYIELMFEETNCVTLCKSCNTSIGTKEELDFDWQIPNEREPVL